MNYLKALLLISAMFLMTTAGALLLQLRSDSMKLTASIQATLGASQVTLQHTDAAVTDLRRTIEIAGGTLNLTRDTLKNEQASIQQANQKTIETMANLDKLVISANQLVTNVNTSQLQVAKDFDATAEGILATLKAADATLDSMNKVVSDPAIQSALDSVNRTSENLQSTSKHVDTVAAFYEKKLTSPRGFLSTVFHGVLQLVVPGSDMATAVRTH